MATGNIAWGDYDRKIVALLSATRALSLEIGARARGRRAIQVKASPLDGISAFEFVFGAGGSSAGISESDESIRRVVAASRRSYRCLESVHSPGEEPKNFSAFVRGGVHKLVDTTLVSVDAEWDYSVGLADYLACACATPRVPRNRAAYDMYRRTRVDFEEAERIAAAASSGQMLSEEKIKHICVLGDLLLSSDFSLLRVFAAAIGNEDFRAALVPEWTRCHGVLVPSEAALFRAGGGSIETWRLIIERVSNIQGFESLSRLSNCLLRDFFILPIIFLFLGLLQLKNKMSASGFTLVGIIAVTIFEDETSFAHALKPRSRWQRLNSISAKYGMYNILNACVDLALDFWTDLPVWVYALPGVFALLLMFSYGAMWYDRIRHPLRCVREVLEDIPELYDRNGKALYWIDKDALAVAVLTEAAIQLKGSSFIELARLQCSDSCTPDSASMVNHVSISNSSVYKLFSDAPCKK